MDEIVSSQYIDKVFQKVLTDYNRSIDTKNVTVLRQKSIKNSNDGNKTKIESNYVIPTAPKECVQPTLRRPSLRKQHGILIEKTEFNSNKAQLNYQTIPDSQTPLHIVIDEMKKRIKYLTKQQSKGCKKVASVRRLRDLVNTTTGESNLSIEGRILTAIKYNETDNLNSNLPILKSSNPISNEYQRVISLQIENKRKRDVDDISKALILPGLVGTKIGEENPLKGILQTTEYQDTFTMSRRNLLEAVHSATPTEYGIVKNDISVWRDVCIAHRQCIYAPSTTMHSKSKKKK